jgi:uncharacterized protein (DUF2235 family)
MFAPARESRVMHQVLHPPRDALHPPGRALIVCCDGTGNIWGNGHDTNVVKLVRRIQSGPQQVVYYDPGVGTTDNFPPIGLWNRFKAAFRRVLGLALAVGIYEDIGRAYEFLMENYQRGDRIYLFGFSRGAFTARCIAGLVNLFGIMRPSAKPMVPVIVRAYFFPAEETSKGRFDRKNRQCIAQDIRDNFCDLQGREAWIYFIGVWDTVASVGGLRNLRITGDAGLSHKRYVHVRHAVSLQEDRYKYEPRLYDDDEARLAGTGRTFKQLWFSGCHSDVGGSYEDSELSDITLQWIMDEALGTSPPLVLKPDSAVRGNPLGLAHDEPFEMPLWALAGLVRRTGASPQSLHPSVTTRAQASAANRKSVWRPLARCSWFWLSLAATLITSALSLGAPLNEVPELELPTVAWAWLYQAWPALYFEPTRLFSVSAGRAAAAWDLLLIPAYACLLSILFVHAHHRWASSTNAAGNDGFVRLYSLSILAVADVGENFSVLVAAESASGWWTRYLMAPFSAIKLAAMLAFGWYVLRLAWARR